MSETGAVKQSEAMADIPPGERKGVRDGTLATHDWYKQGTTIWIRPSGLRKLGILEEEPGLAPVMVELEALHPVSNRRYVACRLFRDGRAQSGKVFCLLPLKIKPERMCGAPRMVGQVIRYGRGKRFKAEEIVKENGEHAYRHEWLAEWERMRSERVGPDA